MTPFELRKLRTKHQISRLELAAHTGIFTEHIQKIEDETVVPLDSDLQRIEKGLRQIISSKKSV